MNTFWAIAVGGVLLFLVCRSTLKVWKLGSAEMSARDQWVATYIAAAVLGATLAILLTLEYARA